MSRDRRGLLLVPVAVLVVAVWVLRHRLGEPPRALLLDAAVAAFASVQCLRAAGRAGNRRARTAWTCQSLACAAWLLAPIAWLTGVTGGPAVASAGRAGFLALAGTGFWLTFRGEDRRARIRMAVDGGVGAAAMVVVAWPLVFAPVWERAGPAVAPTALALAFPLAALVLIIFYAFLALTQLRPGNRRMPGLFVLGLGAVGIADLRLADQGTADSGGWLVGFAAVAAGASIYRGTTRRTSVPSTAAWLAYAPYLPLAAAAATVTAQALGTGAVPAPELAGMVLVVALVLLRQFLVLAENRTLVTRLAARERELVHQALHCPLTGLGNRSLLNTRLQEALDRGSGLALLFCDLDDFKRVNDTLGHQAGDDLLIRVADRLRTTLRPEDTIIRLGGDEFAVLLECTADQARSLADRVWQAFQQPFEVAGHPHAQRASIGLVDVRSAAAPDTATEILKAADLAMYDAKRDGKNGVRVFTARQTTAA